jgi:hypothetical protein
MSIFNSGGIRHQCRAAIAKFNRFTKAEKGWAIMGGVSVSLNAASFANEAYWFTSNLPIVLNKGDVGLALLNCGYLPIIAGNVICIHMLARRVRKSLRGDLTPR